jgi:hypothetical protein
MSNIDNTDNSGNITYSPEIDFTSEKKIEIDNVTGFNSDFQNNYEKFDSDPVNAVKNLFKDYISLTVSQFSDTIGRDFFYINAPNSPPIAIVVFETAKDFMISINNVVMPMRDFLSVTHINANNTTSSEVTLSGGDIRQDVSWKESLKVVCRSDSVFYEFNDVSIPTLTTIISIMNNEYGYLYEDNDEEEEEDEEDDEEGDEEDEIANEEVGEVQKEELGLIRRFIRWIY